MSRSTWLPLLVVGVLFPFFFISGPDYYSTRSFRVLWNFGHIFFFAAAGLLLITSVRGLARKPFFSQLFWVGLFALVIGIAIEVVQYAIQREPDVGDVGRNVLGAIVAVVFFSPARYKLHRRLLWLARVLTLLLVAVPVSSLLMTLFDEQNARDTFPILASFETRAELNRWSGSARFSRSDQHTTHGDYSLQVNLGTEQYSGVSLGYFESDWSGFQLLSVAIFNAESSMLPLTLRIHDQQHSRGSQLYQDRFNRSFALKSGWNHLEISLQDIASAPESRTLDLSAIENLGFFVIAEKTRTTIYMDHLYLK
ncbi:MAG: carbohydrate binding domain-containing protein [Oceanicoccus sp.]